MSLLLNDLVTRNMPSGVISVDRDGRIVGHNPASERIFEGILAEGSPLSSFVRESATLDSLLHRCLDTGSTFTRVEFNVAVSPHADKRIGINLSPIVNAEGAIEGAICLLSDLTEIVELQHQVKLRENFAALGEMSAGLAHELKNSMATIQGYAQMSAVEDDVAALRGYAREIRKESSSLSAMITHFLNFARPVHTSLDPASLTGLLKDALTDLRAQRPGEYAVQFEAAIEPLVECDATLMRQVFLNLLINAAEALKDQGSAGQIRVEVRPARQRNQVRVQVEDNGRGIPAHQLAKIFVPFFTTKSQGTGLGLSLVQKIVLAHNGQIEVQSTEGKGTRFTVSLRRH